MAGEIQLTVIGNLTAEPEVRQVGGANVATFTIAQTARRFKDGEWVDSSTTYVRCSAWRELADHVASSLSKGTRVVAVGRYEQRDYEKDGQKRQAYELQVDEVGASLRYATVQVAKAQTNRNQQQRREQYAQQQAPQQQPQQQAWAGGYDDETPF